MDETPTSEGSPAAESVRAELQRLAGSPAFANSERLIRFLTFVVEEQLAGRGPALKESLIGIEVFGREPGYDPKADPIVRVQARRLRAKLEACYAPGEPLGPAALRILLPKGGYAPEFETAPQPPAVPVPEPAGSARRPRWAVPAAAAALLLMLAAVAGLVWKLRGPNETALAGKGSAAGSRIFSAYPGYQTNPAFSPDGRTLAFEWGGPNADNMDIYLQALDADTPRRLTNSPERERKPVWLPGGQQIGFLRDTGPGQFAVIVVPLQGAGEKRVADLQGDSVTPPRIEWSRDGRKIYTSERTSPDEPERVVEIDLETGAHRPLVDPIVRGRAAGTPGDDEVTPSPDGKWIAFRRRTASAAGDVFVAPATGGGPVRAVTNDRTVIYGLGWTRDSSSLLISSRRSSSLPALWRFRLDGQPPVRLTEAPLSVTSLAVSPADGQIAYASRYLDANIWRIDLQGKAAPQRLIASSLLDSCPQYSPDGGRIAFRSNRTGSDEIWIADEHGGSPVKLTNFGGPVTGSPRWSPDRRNLVFDSRPNGNADVFLIAADGGRPRSLTVESSNEVTPNFSADGKSVYFASDRSGSWQIWKQKVEPEGRHAAAVQITKNGGFAPQESGDGGWLYYTKINSGKLFRMSTRGPAEEEIVLDSLGATLWGGWSLSGSRIWFAAMPGTLKQHEAGSVRTVAQFTFPPLQWDGSLAISPGSRFALVAQLEREGSEIHLRPE